ncbi:hypothetical protein CEXT_768751 [Caerostris extrusa]|uniref:Uncharacterized protein n=1 Tax=Caerostris extrusa TaxID=172846 RepID=A0AAV4Q1N3_CAEEX|nr:hypothetical protein CEXT_768751 [Caerostris extrusa]
MPNISIHALFQAGVFCISDLLVHVGALIYFQSRVLVRSQCIRLLRRTDVPNQPDPILGLCFVDQLTGTRSEELIEYPFACGSLKKVGKEILLENTVSAIFRETVMGLKMGKRGGGKKD